MPISATFRDGSTMDFHDAFSSWSHLLTSLWAAFAGAFLLRLASQRGSGFGSCAVYVFTMVGLYAASGLFHGVRHDTPGSFAFFQKLDKSFIFLFVAGSYTPVFFYLLRGHKRVGFTAAVWAFAAVGVALLWLLPAIPQGGLILVYAGMASIGLLPTRDYMRNYGLWSIAWVYGTFATYVAGAIVEVAKWPVPVPGVIGPHEILHITDTLGTVFSFAFILKIAVRIPPSELRFQLLRVSKTPVQHPQRSSVETEHSAH